MSLTKSDIPDLLLPGLRTEFELAYRSETENSTVEKLATTISTTLPIQKYAWLGSTPVMREFLDERRAVGLNAFATSIEDKTFESTIAVDRKAIEDDQLDLIRLRIKDMALRVSQHRHQMIVEALAAGFTTNGYDGVSFFNTAHPTFGSSTYSNRSVDVLSSTSLAGAISQMMTVPDDTGTPLGIVPDTLVVGPKQMWTALELVESKVAIYKGNSNDVAPSNSYDNVFNGRLKVIVTPYLQGTSDDYWFLLDTKRPIRALIMQQRSDVPLEFTALDSATGGESAFMRDRFHYGVRARYNVGYGLWQTAFGGLVS